MTMATEAALRRNFVLRFQQMSAFSNAQDHPCQIHTATLVPWIVLAIGMATSSAASAGIADLKAVPEVAKTNRWYY